MLVSDCSLEFKNGINQEFANSHKTIIQYTTSENPQSNDLIKRFHTIVMEHIRIVQGKYKQLNVIDQMPYAILGYNNSTHSTTKQKTKYILNCNFDTHNPFNIDRLIKFHIASHRQKIKFL